MSEVKEPEQPVDVYSAINAVMNEVKAVGKEGKNTFDKYNFRGIDGVMNAVGPALRKHGVITVPTVMDCQREKVTTGKGAVMTSVVLRMMVRWYGPGGDYIETIVWGEAFDRGDKATAKAHSVAFRTAILQTLCLPTQEPDPDEFSYEQGPALDESTRTMILGQIQGTASVEGLQELWRSLAKDGLLDQRLKDAITARVEAVKDGGAA